MEINRNQYFMIGLVVILLGIQFRLVDRFVLTQPLSQFIAEKKAQFQETEQEFHLISATANQAFTATGTVPNHVIQLPEWLGYALISVGAVLVLHALAMPKPG